MRIRPTVRWARHGDVWEAYDKRDRLVGIVHEAGANHFRAATTRIPNREPKTFDCVEGAQEWIEWAAIPYWARSFIEPEPRRA